MLRSSQSEMQGSRLNWESVSGDIFRCLCICEILWDELFVLDLALSQNSRWLLGLLFYVLISARKIHSPRSVTPNPSHLCNIELYNTRVDECKCTPIIFLLLPPRQSEQDVHHLVSPGPAMREIGTPIPIRECVRRGKQPGAEVPDTLFPDSARDGVTLLQVLGVSLCFPGRLANNQDKRAQPSEALYFPNSPNRKDVESSRPEILLNVSTGTSWTVQLFQAVVCFNCIEEFKVGWLTWPC